MRVLSFSTDRASVMGALLCSCPTREETEAQKHWVASVVCVQLASCGLPAALPSCLSALHSPFSSVAPNLPCFTTENVQ